MKFLMVFENYSITFLLPTRTQTETNIGIFFNLAIDASTEFCSAAQKLFRNLIQLDNTFPNGGREFMP